MKMEEGNRADFLPDQVRNKQDNDKDVNEQIVETEIAQPCVAVNQTLNRCLWFRSARRQLANS